MRHETNVHERIDGVLRIAGLLPSDYPPRPLYHPPLALHALRVASIASRLLNTTIHVLAAVSVATIAIVGLERLLSEGTTRELLGAIVVLLIVLILLIAQQNNKKTRAR